MKKNLLLIVTCACLINTFSNAQSLINSVSIYITFYVDNACTQPGIGNGYVMAAGQGGTPPYTYTWSNGTTGDLDTGLLGGTYTVTVTDAAFGTASASQTIADNIVGTYNTIYILFPSHGATDGRFDVAGYPGTGFDLPVAFHYFNQTTGISYDSLSMFNQYGRLENVAPGDWSTSITTNSGCTGTLDFTISEWPDFNPSVTVLPSCTGTANGECIVHPSPQGPLPLMTNMAMNPNNPTFFPNIDFTLNVEYQLYDSAGINFISNTASYADSTFSNLAAGSYLVKFAIFGIDSMTGLHFNRYEKPVSFTIPSTNNCGSVSGQVFNDANGDCVFNGGDIALPNVKVEFDPGGYLVNTDNNGNFTTNIPFGTYTLQQHTYLYAVQKCPTAGYNFMLDSITTNAVIAIADSVDFTPDGAVIHGAYTAARPGFNLVYAIAAVNHSPNNCAPAIVTFNFDPSLTFISSDHIYTSLTASQIQFNLDTLTAFESNSIHVTFSVPAGAVLGDTLFSTSSLTAANGETSLGNNNYTSYVIVTSAIDPNEKSVFPEGDIKPVTDLEYTIRFQNTGTDTAFTVTVTDTISPFLDIASLQPGAASHSYTYDFPTPNIVRFTFSNILLADSNTNEPLSHGFINYTIRQKQNNPVGTLIENTAGIYFDFNAPVMTNTTQNTVQTVFTGINSGTIIPFSVYPNPVKDELMIRFTKSMRNVKIDFINMPGETVLKTLLPQLSAGKVLHANLSRLPAGVYLLKINDGENVFNQRIIKQ